MHASLIVERLIGEVTPRMHDKRRAALSAAVSSVLDGASLSVTALGRGITGSAYEKHRIKRADRLLSNRYFQGERLAIYTALCRRLLAGMSRPVVSVDWSNLDRGKTRYLLRASVAVSGRGMTLYEEVHPRERFMKAAVERDFLRSLAQMLDAKCQPIIVTDAGFHNPWLRAVEALGWDYISRVRGRVMLACSEQNDWEQARSLFPLATTQARALSKTRLSRAEPQACQFVIVKTPRRYRHDLNVYSRRAHGHYSNKQARSHREPWLLATSLPNHSVTARQRLVRAYTTRMQIEESFRDLKSERFGFGYDVSRSTQIARIEGLLLIALIAVMAAWIIGLRTLAAGVHQRYQANTVKHRAVLSIVYLGRRVWADPRMQHKLTRWRDALTQLRSLIVAHCDNL